MVGIIQGKIMLFWAEVDRESLTSEIFKILDWRLQTYTDNCLLTTDN